MRLFNFWKAKLSQKTPEGARAIMRTDPRHWSRAWFKLGSNCDSVDNNMCESFNNWIISARYLPIISMLEAIRCKIMIRIHEQKTKAVAMKGLICHVINKKINFFTKLSGNCHAIWNGKDAFEAKHWDNRFTVNLIQKTCSCRYWQLSGLPCCHAISCICYTSRRIEEFVADCYKVKVQNNMYSHCLEPLEGMNAWPESNMPRPLPPGYVRMPGRPTTKRRKELDEKPRGPPNIKGWNNH